jgi:hypothetical protein
MSSVPRLLPSQVCFVVDDVPAAAAECSERYRWGPFHHFTVRVPDAHYRGWKGLRCNDVALGMAGGVQVELVHVHEGREPIADYQTRYGTGFQHLGIGCRSRDVALLHLEMLGAQVNELNEHEGIRIAFVDVPTGTAMFELLQFPPRGEGDAGIEASARPQEGGDVFALDRATIVTSDLAGALRFHAGAFGWEDPQPRTETLRYGGATTRVKRYLGRAGKLELELLEPEPGSRDPYAAHLERGDHGLIHAGGMLANASLPDEVLAGEWAERGEHFTLHDWAGGKGALQLRRPSP